MQTLKANCFNNKKENTEKIIKKSGYKGKIIFLDQINYKNKIRKKK